MHNAGKVETADRPWDMKWIHRDGDEVPPHLL